MSSNKSTRSKSEYRFSRYAVEFLNSYYRALELILPDEKDKIRALRKGFGIEDSVVKAGAKDELMRLERYVLRGLGIIK